VLVQAVMAILALQQGQVLKLVVMLVAVERVVGAVMQVRGMIEHHGLWQRNSTHEFTQLYSSRNIASGALLNVGMGGLPHHSLHHAYLSSHPVLKRRTLSGTWARCGGGPSRIRGSGRCSRSRESVTATEQPRAGKPSDRLLAKPDHLSGPQDLVHTVGVWPSA
jgi:hypothetical protein